MNNQDCVNKIDVILASAKAAGLDHEEILARVYAKHMSSESEQCDCCHIYGISFGEKVLKAMNESRDQDRK